MRAFVTASASDRRPGQGRLLALALLAAVVYLGYSCTITDVVEVPVGEVSIQPSTVEVIEGGSVQLSARATDRSGKSIPAGAVTWSVTDLSVATINDAGMVQGVRAGATTARATLGGVTGQAAIAVQPGPSLAVSPAQLLFAGSVGLPPPPPQDVTITNGGGGTLDGISTSASYEAGGPTGWLSLGQSGTSAPTALTASVLTASLGQGTYRATITLTAAGARNSPVTIPVELRLSLDRPTIGVDPDSVEFEIGEGFGPPPPRIVQITNLGGGTLTGLELLSSPGSRFSLSLAGTTAPTQLTIQADPAGLSLGTYRESILIRSPAAASPAEIAVILRIVQAPQAELRLAKTGPATAVAGEPLSYTIAVTNQGPSTARGLAISDTLPPGVSYVSSSDGGGLDAGAGPNGVVTWTVDSLSVSSSITRTVSVITSPATPGLVSNVAAVGSITRDLQQADNEDGITTAVASSLQVSSNTLSPSAGSQVIVTAQLTDGGGNPVAAAGRTVSWSSTNGGTFSSTTSPTNAGGATSVSFTTSTTAGVAHVITATTGATGGTSSAIVTQSGSAGQYLVSTSDTVPVAGTPVTITAQLADGLGNPVAASGRVVTWSSTNGGTLPAPTAADTTDASGVASVTFTTSLAAGTVHTVSATTGSITGVSPSITTQTGPAAQYVVTSSDYAPLVGSQVTITAQLADANGNPVATAGNTVTWTSTGGGSFSAPTTDTDVAGIAVVTFTTSGTAGTPHVVTATTGTVTGDSPSITTQSGAASQYLVTSSDYTPVAGSQVTITAQLADASGNPVATAGNTVTWGSTNAGSFATPTSTTDAAGIATVIFTTNPKAGTVHVVSGTTSALTGSSLPITTQTGPAAKYLVTSSSYAPVAGSQVTISAQLADANDNPVATSGNTVTWGSTNGGTPASPTSTTDAAGIATVLFTTSTTAGTVHTVTGTDGGGLTGTSASITTVAGPATQYLVTSSDYAPVAGAQVTITAQLADANDNPVATSGNTVTWGSTNGGTPATPTSTTDAAGIATVLFTTSTTAGTTHTVTGTDGGGLTGTTANITTVVGPATQYLVTASDYAPVAGAQITISAQLADANNNPVATSGNTVTWGSTNGGTPATPTSTTDAAGIATVLFTTSTTAGVTHTVTGTDGGGLTGTSANIVTQTAAATQYLVTSSDYAPAAGAQVTITAQLADANGNPVATSGNTVTWGSTNGGAPATPTSTTDAAGIATVLFTTSTTAGVTHTVTGTDGGGLTGTTANITTVAGPAAQYLVTASDYAPVDGNSITITAQLADANDNPVARSGQKVVWSSNNTGNFNPSQGPTSPAGTAQTDFTLQAGAGTVYVVTATTGAITGDSPPITSSVPAPLAMALRAVGLGARGGPGIGGAAGAPEADRGPDGPPRSSDRWRMGGASAGGVGASAPSPTPPPSRE